MAQSIAPFLVKFVAKQIAKRLAGRAGASLLGRTVTGIAAGQAIDRLLPVIEEDLDGPVEDASREEIEGALERARQRGRITTAQLQQVENNMPVQYSDWVGIVFDVAKSKGFRPSSTFESGNANAQLVSLAADIWADRKDEMRTAADARRIAEAEVHVT